MERRVVMYYLTVGYPLGAEIVENRMVSQVSFQSVVVNLIPLEYRIWSKFLLGAYETDVKKTLSEADLNGFAPTMNKLLQTGLLAGFPDGDFSGMRELIFLRQGIGTGLDLQSNVHCVVFRGKIELSVLEYDVWKSADGMVQYAELEKKVGLKHQLSCAEVQKTVIELCRRGLLLAVNREERYIFNEIT